MWTGRAGWWIAQPVMACLMWGAAAAQQNESGQGSQERDAVPKEVPGFWKYMASHPLVFFEDAARPIVTRERMLKDVDELVEIARSDDPTEVRRWALEEIKRLADKHLNAADRDRLQPGLNVLKMVLKAEKDLEIRTLIEETVRSIEAGIGKEPPKGVNGIIASGLRYPPQDKRAALKAHIYLWGEIKEWFASDIRRDDSRSGARGGPIIWSGVQAVRAVKALETMPEEWFASDIKRDDLLSGARGGPVIWTAVQTVRAIRALKTMPEADKRFWQKNNTAQPPRAGVNETLQKAGAK